LSKPEKINLNEHLISMLRCEKIQRFLANYSRIIMAAYAELCSRVRTQIGKRKMSKKRD
jgi:hypothetical protein